MNVQDQLETIEVSALISYIASICHVYMKFPLKIKESTFGKTRCCTLRRANNTPTRSFVSRTVNRKQMCNHFFQQKLRYLLRKCERTDKRTDGRTDKVIAIQPPLYEWGYNIGFWDVTQKILGKYRKHSKILKMQGTYRNIRSLSTLEFCLPLWYLQTLLKPSVSMSDNLI